MSIYCMFVILGLDEEGKESHEELLLGNKKCYEVRIESRDK